ncbi:hypothetical protein XELAEV_18029589mg [Xenopus laevis]|uniref:Uncharacterized protein n=1 Tax=Xenopus laevis TaxID=8355 RepID=A0A974CTK4_XENLA|nr:hypothetical protein XELAEV_18029589mg [Xenopus laevis]
MLVCHYHLLPTGCCALDIHRGITLSEEKELCPSVPRSRVAGHFRSPAVASLGLSVPERTRNRVLYLSGQMTEKIITSEHYWTGLIIRDRLMGPAGLLYA